MKQPKPVVFVDTEEERAQMMQDYHLRKARGRREAVIWSAVALALYGAQILWGRLAPSVFVWLAGEVLLVAGTAFAVAKLADSKSQTRWLALLAAPPLLGKYFLVYASAFVAAMLALMPTPPEVPSIRLRSESRAWET